MSTDERILQGATLLFRDRGFHGVSVAEIGKAAGVSGPAIYKHFTGKDEILAVLFQRAMERLLLRLQPPADGEAWAQLDAIVAGVLRFVLEERDLVLVYLQEHRFLAQPWRRTLHRQIAGHLERWTTIIARCRPELSREHAHALARACNDMIFAVASWPSAARSVPGLEMLIGELVRSGIGGVAAGGAGRLHEELWLRAGKS